MNDSKYKNSRGSRDVTIPVELVDEIAEIEWAWDGIADMLAKHGNNGLYFLLKPHMEQMCAVLHDITERYETAESDNEEVPFRIPRVPASPTHPCDIGKKGGAQ